MRITTESALEHLELLYELSGFSDITSDNFMTAYDTDWLPCPPEEVVESFSSDLESVDDIRANICKLARKGIALPIPEIVLDGYLILFDDHTALGEPCAWIYLKDKTSVEITHEESGLDLKDQYFSVRHHCSEEDFENDVYHSTMGVIEQCSGGLASIAGMLERIIKESGIEELPAICPICGAPAQKSILRESRGYELCCSNCGCKTKFDYTSADVSVMDDNLISATVSNHIQPKATSKHLHLQCCDPRNMISYLSKRIDFGHSPSIEDISRIAAAGYSVASEMYKRHNCAKIEAEAEELFNAALNELPTENQSGGSSLILLREVEDGELYGVLLADGPDDAELTSAFLSAKEAVAKSDPEWQVADILARLPKEWNARVEMPGSIYI